MHRQLLIFLACHVYEMAGVLDVTFAGGYSNVPIYRITNTYPVIAMTTKESKDQDRRIDQSRHSHFDVSHLK